MDIKAITETMMNRMREIIESGQEPMPMVFTVSHQGEIDIIGIADMVDDSAKDCVAVLLRALSAKLNVACVIFLCDSYMGTVKNEEYHEDINVRTLPGRKEAIIASVSGRGMSGQLACLAYERTKEGKPKFGAIEWHKGESTGRFAPGDQKAACQ